MKHVLLGSLLAVSATLGTATVAWGHAVQTDYFVDLLAEEVELQLTATYSTGEPMEAATVLVFAPDNDDTPWLESQTDETGNFTFLPDESLPGDWRIEFKKEGHQDILVIPVDADGIDFNNISQVGNTDVHYARLAPEAIGILSAVSLGVLVVAVRRRSLGRV